MAWPGQAFSVVHGCIKLNIPSNEEGGMKSKGLIEGKTATMKKCPKIEKGRVKIKGKMFKFKRRKRGVSILNKSPGGGNTKDLGGRNLGPFSFIHPWLSLVAWWAWLTVLRAQLRILDAWPKALGVWPHNFEARKFGL